MKKIFTLGIILFITGFSMAQAPEKMSYQSLIRDVNNDLLRSAPVGMQISILQGSPTGSTVYVETHSASTNVNGLVSLEIGTGTVISGDFSQIDWTDGPFYIQTETDPSGGQNYTISGTSQLMSVPYALHAKTAEKITTKEKFYMGQDTLGGIVYYLYKDENGNQRGLLVNKNESVEIWQVSPTVTGADRTDDGAYNTALMTNSGAAAYATGQGTGWYVPSVDELDLLFRNRFTANRALRDAGHVMLSTGDYWSSTEYTNDRALKMNFGTGTISSSPKANGMIVRAIKAF